MNTPRSSGVLLHPTCLPGLHGIGEIGAEARRLIDCLADARQRWWQILPLGPTSYGDSPYQSLSSFAGNDLLVDFQGLIDQGLLDAEALAVFRGVPRERVDYGAIIPLRRGILNQVAAEFATRADEALLQAYQAFVEGAAWLDDYALFVALKDEHDGHPWVHWATPYRDRHPEALDEAADWLADRIEAVKVGQFLFDHQWRALRAYAGERGVGIIGDIPIFVAHDSADVWVHRDHFFLDDTGHPTVVAGVPPDYFSATGQRWGNPLYDWARHRQDDYAWWVARMRHTLSLVDVVRIDHFRGFEKNWEIPGDEETAINGRWVDGPGHHFFERLQAQLGEGLPIIAEDLGLITEEVEMLRDAFGFPGMRIMHFSYGDGQEDRFRPDGFPEPVVVYTGTHDNDTTQGWYHQQAGEGSTDSGEQLDALRHMVNSDLHIGDGHRIHWDLLSRAHHTRARTSMVPMQDLLGRGSEARMNRPGIPAGNWQWRFTWESVPEDVWRQLAELTQASGRG